jgi:hypothetical protein
MMNNLPELYKPPMGINIAGPVISAFPRLLKYLVKTRFCEPPGSLMRGRVPNTRDLAACM